MRKIMILFLLWIGAVSAHLYGQQYTGITGLAHIPTAEMTAKGNMRFGGHYIYKSLTPDSYLINGKEYNTYTYYAGFTPTKWLEVAYVSVLKKGWNNEGDETFNDRHWFTAIKIRPLEEAEYRPSIAIGTQNLRDYFSNNPKSRYVTSYISATKHFVVGAGKLGAHLTYRRYENDLAQDRWGGAVGGITYSTDYVKGLQISAEFNGDVLITAGELKVWKYLVLQAMLVDGAHFCGGVGVSLPL